MKRKWILAGSALLIFSLHVSGIQAQTFKHMKNRVKEKTLTNGMKWVVFERHDAPVVSFNLYADVGAANESYGITGISHLLEHMAFKGSKTVGTTDYAKEKPLLEEMDRLYALISAEKAGQHADTVKINAWQARFDAVQAEAKSLVVSNELIDLFDREGEAGINAGTNNDCTQYLNALPSNRLEFWMAATSDRFMNPVFREFYTERNVVIEERRMRTETQPLGRLMEDFFAAAFKAHPYHHSVVGHMSDLNRITRQDVIDYFNTYYIPSNMVVSVAGDVDAKTVFKLAERYFGRIDSGPKPLPPRTIEPEQWGERHIKVTAQSQPILLVGYHRPAGNHPDDAALGALTNIIGEGRSSWLYHELVKEKKIAIQCGAFNGFPGDKYPNLIAFFAVPAQGHTAQECLDAIDEAIARVRTEAVSAEELTKYKRSTKKGIIDAMKSNSGMARMLAEAEAKEGGWEAFFEAYNEVQSVSAEAIKTVAEKYLVRSNRTVGEIVPEK